MRKWSRQTVRMREASVEDYGKIAALHIRHGLATKPHEDWKALWRDNPVYKHWNGQWPIGWVLENGNGEIVGSVGNMLLAFQFRGRELRAATPVSWAVDERYRGDSMLPVRQVMRQRDIDLFLTTTVSSRVEPIVRLFRLVRVPVGTWHKSAFWITNYRGFSQIALRMKSVPLATVMSYPVSAALFCRDRVKDIGMRVHGSTCEVELCAEFDSRFDDFWEELKRQSDDVLLAVRTAETLAWHFRDRLLRQSAWVLAVPKGSRLIAYAIFDRQDNPALGLKRVRLVDFQSLNGSEEALRSALCWMLQKCREEGIHLLEVTGGWLNRPDSSEILPPHHRTLPSWAYYYKANCESLGAMLKDPRVWAPSSFDGDASL
jgi:hypothetical protein